MPQVLKKRKELAEKCWRALCKCVCIENLFPDGRQRREGKRRGGSAQEDLCPCSHLWRYVRGSGESRAGLWKCVAIVEERWAVVVFGEEGWYGDAVWWLLWEEVCRDEEVTVEVWGCFGGGRVLWRGVDCCGSEEDAMDGWGCYRAVAEAVEVRKELWRRGGAAEVWGALWLLRSVATEGRNNTFSAQGA